jgi:hypothetical protein
VWLAKLRFRPRRLILRQWQRRGFSRPSYAYGFSRQASPTDYLSEPNGDFMRQAVLTILGALLVAGSSAQIATASEHHVQNARRAPAAIGEQFRNANDSIARRASGFCSQESGNPYNEQTDYMGWAAFRESGAWDSRNDCQ